MNDLYEYSYYSAIYKKLRGTWYYLVLEYYQVLENCSTRNDIKVEVECAGVIVGNSSLLPTPQAVIPSHPRPPLRLWQHLVKPQHRVHQHRPPAPVWYPMPFRAGQGILLVKAADGT